MKPDIARIGLFALILNLSLSFFLAGCTGDTLLSAYLETNRARLDQPVSAEVQPTQFVIQPGQPAQRHR